MPNANPYNYSDEIASQVSGPDDGGNYAYTCSVRGCASPDRKGEHYIKWKYAAAGAYEHRAAQHPKLPR